MDFKVARHYNHLRIQHLMIKYTFKREVMRIVPKFSKEQKNTMRMFRIHNINQLQWLFRFSHIFDGQRYPVQFYHSLAMYNTGVPRRNTQDKGEKEYYETFKESSIKNIVSYDFFLDIDSPTEDKIQVASSDTYKICSYLDDMKIPYSLRFSGNGFHIFIPHSSFTEIKHHFNPYTIEGSIYSLYTKIAQAITKRFTEFVDESIYDSRRVIKIPFSVSITEKKAYVVAPLQKEELLTFIPGIYEVETYGMTHKSFLQKYDTLVLPCEKGRMVKLIKDLGIKWDI